jgi:hypothetical protein
MKKYKIILIFTFFALFLFNVNTTVASGTAYKDMLGTTHYSDGSTSYTDMLGTTHFSGGGTAYKDMLGTTHYSGSYNGNPSGSSYTDMLGTTHYNFNGGTSGSAYTDMLGSSHYSDNKGNSGSSYTDMLGTTHYTGNIFTTPSCPTNSSYDSLSKGCKCNFGYAVNGSSCVYKTASYASYSTNSNACPLNSHTSTTDMTKCQCNSGYQVNATKTVCSPVPLETNNQICQASFGLNVIWDGTKTSSGSLNCNCRASYGWNAAKTACTAY